MTRQFLFGTAAVFAVLTGTLYRINTVSVVPPMALAAAPSTVHGGPLFQQDFNAANPWPQISAAAVPAKKGVTVSAEWKPVGTVDEAKSTTASGALVLSVQTGSASAAPGAWSARLVSGLLPVHATETNLDKLTLSFDHSVSSVRPITVQIESFNAQKKRTGGREVVVYPAGPDFYLRSALEVGTMTAFGGGTFTPTDPFVQITWTINGVPGDAGDADAAKTPVLRIDNVAYASPAWYVSPSGNDENDGRTEKTAVASPQKAIDAAQPGDIVLLMDGTYGRPPHSTVQNGVIDFVHGGTSAAWISVKNYPGQHPTITSDSWHPIKIGRGGAGRPATAETLCYLEVRGLHVRGNADTISKTHPELLNVANPLTNGGGPSGDGGNEIIPPHHLRFADNFVEHCGGGGIGLDNCDWVTIENNTIRDNCWWTIYAPSGILLLGWKNFDATENVYKDLVRNNVLSGNQCFDKWKSVGRYSDGNGIIIDTNYVPKKNQIYLGRTLIQNNLCFNNGGSGIHVFRGHHVDIVNNTAYYNGASPELRWGQIFVQESDDVHILNNIAVSRPGQAITSVGPGGGDQNSTSVVRGSNIYFGGLTPKLTGDSDQMTDPLFVNASTDAAIADFHVQPGSPALKSGWQGALAPLRDLDNKPRGDKPDRGAYQYSLTAIRTATIPVIPVRGR